VNGQIDPEEQGETVEEAWQSGYQHASNEADEAIEEKDAFIAKQGSIIVEMMGVIERAGDWYLVPDDLREKLRDYV
jgi:hypothetical protein